VKDLYQVIKKPVITEKSTAQALLGKYTFEVGKTCSKGEVRQAVEKIFGVTVLNVQTMKMPKGWKKAIVTLREGDKIELFEVGG